jgi:hypothetical protein
MSVFQFQANSIETAFRVVHDLPPADVRRLVVDQADVGRLVTLDLPAGCEVVLRHVLRYAAPAGLPTLTELGSNDEVRPT